MLPMIVGKDLREDEGGCWLFFTKPPVNANIWIRSCIFRVPFPCLRSPDQFCIRSLCFHYNLAARAPLNRRSGWRQFFPWTIYFPLGSLPHCCSYFRKEKPQENCLCLQSVILDPIWKLWVLNSSYENILTLPGNEYSLEQPFTHMRANAMLKNKNKKKWNSHTSFQVPISPSSQYGKSGRLEVSTWSKLLLKHVLCLIGFLIGNNKVHTHYPRFVCFIESV